VPSGYPLPVEHHPDVDAWLAATDRWRDASVRLRAILRDCDLDEAIKWGKPCYAHGGANIAIVQPFRGFLALLFLKGVLLEAPEGVLREQGENTHAARRVCFTSAEEVSALEATLRDLVRQAVQVEAEGAPLPERDALVLVAELQARLDADPALNAAFGALTPGRQRAYHLHIASAAASATRSKRVEAVVPRILAGKGLRDR
jgi:uncharacterized protein YdeI (YjbR/CyaY-like superfamily)